ncbi:MAG: DUF1501 domain-containing protein [Verrucomicrobiales bacterium]|nr:DUF1501 domain-containing protein [Verrucomicrobiales bacterium]
MSTPSSYADLRQTAACHRFASNRVSRRTWLATTGGGFGALAFQALANDLATAATHPYSIASTHHAPRARRIIFLFMHGGVSQVDSFDYKPRIQSEAGRPLPFKGLDHLDATQKNGGNGIIFPSPWQFRQAGQSGNWVSDLWPEVSRHIDDLCFIKSMHTKGVSHGQAVSMLHTGTDSLVRPSMGAWISYGLGSENADLPAFVSVAPPRGHGGPRNYGPAFLPAQHQATAIGHSGQSMRDATIRHLENDAESPRLQLRQIALLQQMNRAHLDRSGGDPRIEGVIESYEMAHRMQAVAPALLDIAGEPDHIRNLYGLDRKETADFGHRCLLARRLCESGVRFVQVSTPYVWDQHGNLESGHAKNALAVDRPIAGLLSDLKQRGLMDDTLVVWATEFGRTPIAQGSNGRDHNPAGFTIWLAGAGVKAGYSHGETDDYGYYAVKDKVHTHDLHATLLHLLGLDHERLTYRHAGRDFRLTDVYGEVVHPILS